MAKSMFKSPYDQHAKHNGKAFETLRELTDEERDPEVGTMYLVKLETGEEIHAWPEELDADLLAESLGY